MWMSSTFFVLDSQSDFRWNNTRFEFSDYCTQSMPKWCHYQILLFGGDVVELSVATRYGASKYYLPTRNIVTIIESFCDGSMLGLRFRARFWTKWPFWRISSPFEPHMRIVNSALCNLIVGKDCCFLPQNLSGCPLVQKLTASSFRTSLSKVVCW
jgi:hypothetical protein